MVYTSKRKVLHLSFTPRFVSNRERVKAGVNKDGNFFLTLFSTTIIIHENVYTHDVFEVISPVHEHRFKGDKKDTKGKILKIRAHNRHGRIFLKRRDQATKYPFTKMICVLSEYAAAVLFITGYLNINDLKNMKVVGNSLLLNSSIEDMIIIIVPASSEVPAIQFHTFN